MPGEKAELKEAVLDASIFVQAFIREDYTDLAIKLLRRLRRIYEPPILLYEVGNVFTMLVRRGIISSEEAKAKFNLACNTPILEIREPDEREVLDLALELGLTFYDCSYLKLSMKLKIPLITADNVLYERGKEAAYVISASQLSRDL